MVEVPKRTIADEALASSINDSTINNSDNVYWKIIHITRTARTPDKVRSAQDIIEIERRFCSRYARKKRHILMVYKMVEMMNRNSTVVIAIVR